MKIRTFLFGAAFALLMCLKVDGIAAENLGSLPMGRGLPIDVYAGIAFASINSIQENDSSVEATVDTRLTWIDRRLSYEKSKAIIGFIEFKDEAADKRLAEIWHPKVEFANSRGAPSLEDRSLRIYPDGSVDLIMRERGKFSADFSMQNFPFDKQILSVDLISRSEPSTKVLLNFTESQLNFSNSIHPPESSGWDFRRVSLKKGHISGLRDTQYSVLTASLQIKRQVFSAISTIILPLVCCLLIPLLVLWVNTLNDDEHLGFGEPNSQLASFAMTGIFAVVALNFTVGSSYVQLIQGDNPVIRLFALNYFMLALSIVISVALYRYHVIKRLYGRYVQAEVFHVLCWSIPILCFGVAAAILFSAWLG